MDYVYDVDTLKIFIEKQEQLFPERIVETLDEADEFLDENFAVIVNSKREVVDYFEEAGVDFEEEDVLEAAEVFDLENGKYLIIEA